MIASAPTAIESHSESENPVGSAMLGSPVGTSPTITTPWSARLNAETARIPRITTMKARGSRGALKRIRSNRQTATVPTTRVAALVSPTSCSTPTSTSQYDPSSFGIPRILGS